MAQDISSIAGPGAVSARGQQSAPYTNSANAAPSDASSQDRAATAQSQVQAAKDAVREQLAATNSDLRFETDQETGMTVISVVDQDTGKVLRQIPSQEEVRLAHVLDKMLQGQVEDTA